MVELNGKEVKSEELINVTGGASPVSCITYVVRRGDSLATIAQKYHTTVAILAELNHIQNVNLIYAGTLLLIPVTK